MKNQILYSINMGYLNPAKPVPGDSIAWNKEEDNYTHPWALERRLFNFGYYKLSEIFESVNEYLNTPADLVDLISTKVMEGAERRSMDDKAAMEAARKKDKGDLTPAELQKLLS